MNNHKMNQRNRVYLRSDDNIYFTPRERDCLVHLLDQKTIRETAAQVGLSNRTVEFYLNNMKNKMTVRTKKELIQKILQTDFLHRIKELERENKSV